MCDIRRLKLIFVACALAAGAYLGLASTSAQAQSIDTITCTGSRMTTFSPPITDEPALVTFSAEGTYGPCISTVPGITGGTFSASSLVNRSCLTLLGDASYSDTVHWNNGQSSTAQVQASTSIAGALVTVTAIGTVTNGAFQGRNWVQQLTAPALDITLCTLGLGNVASINFVDVLEIL